MRVLDTLFVAWTMPSPCESLRLGGSRLVSTLCSCVITSLSSALPFERVRFESDQEGFTDFDSIHMNVSYSCAQKCLSPLRLPFRHTGGVVNSEIIRRNDVTVKEVLRHFAW